MNQITIKWKRLTEKAVIPTKAHATDAGMDMRVLVTSTGEFSCATKRNLPIHYETVWDPDLGTPSQSVVILPHQSVIFHTGLACAIPEGYYMELVPRSSLGFKFDLMIANTVGIIDADYRGEIMVSIHNNSNEPQRVCDGDRVIQCMLKEVLPVENIEVEELDETERGEGGFGSTGTK